MGGGEFFFSFGKNTVLKWNETGVENFYKGNSKSPFFEVKR